MAKRYELNDRQWARIADKVPGKKGRSRSNREGQPPVRQRRPLGLAIRSAVGRAARAVRQVEERAQTLRALGEEGRMGAYFCRTHRDPKNEYVMLDATLVRAHQQAATGKGAAKKGERTRLWGVPEVD